MLPQIRIASPCMANWERMTGDDRARHCAQCNLEVYNLSEMTEGEINRLLADAKGQRLCGRLYRRADGTVLTRDCPVGFRAVVRRVSRVAGAALSTVMSVGFASAQTPQKDSALMQIAPSESRIDVVVVDESGAVIQKAQVFVRDAKGPEVAKGLSNAIGEYRSPGLPPGSYVLTVQSAGFRPHAENIGVRSHEATRLRVELAAGGAMMMGVMVDASLNAPEPTPSSGIPNFLPDPDGRPIAAVSTANGTKKSKTIPTTK